MRYRQLGDTGVDVSLLSYGTGGPSKFGQATGLDDAGRDALVARALELGVNLFDTAATYGQAEAMLGRALRGHPRGSYLLATKWSARRHGEPVTDPELPVRSLEESLRRLRTDYVDLFQIHCVLPEHYDRLAEIFIPVMQRLQAQGKTRFIGVTGMLRRDPRHEAMTMALQRHPHVWDTVMFKYGILNQSGAKRALPLAASASVGVLNMAPVRFTLTRRDSLRERMEEWGAAGGETALDWLSVGDPAELIRKGYQFAAEPEAITTVLTGTSSLTHLEANAAAIDGTLPDEALARLKSDYADSASPD